MCLSQGHNTVTFVGINPGPLYSEFGALLGNQAIVLPLNVYVSGKAVYLRYASYFHKICVPTKRNSL